MSADVGAEGWTIGAGSHALGFTMRATSGGLNGPWAVPVTPRGSAPGQRNSRYYLGSGWANNVDYGFTGDTGIDLAFKIEGTTQAVPEPTTLAVLAVGAAFLRRRRFSTK